MELTQFRVVVNDEEQYSIWAADEPAPAGWADGGFTGSRQECLDHIDRVWTDLRPRSLREAMDGAVTAAATAAAAEGRDE